MELYVLNKDLEILSAITTYDELIWKRKLCSPGTFKMSVYFTSEMNMYLKEGNLIRKSDDEEPGVIDTKVLKIDTRGREMIVVSGMFASGYTKRRIAWGQYNIDGNIETAMRTLVDENCINPENENRIIPKYKLGTLNNLTGTISRQVEYDNLCELLSEIAGCIGYGWRVRADLTNKELLFEVYEGIDRTSDAENRVIFSRDFGNVYTQNYNYDESKHKNMCLIGGEEKEGETRQFVTANDDKEGLGRYEMWYDGGGVRSEVEDANGNRSQLTPEEYRALLLSTAQEKLQDFYISKAFEAKARSDNGTVYKVDYDLGDYVTFRDLRWGIQVDTQITEIEETYSKKEKSIEITFGDNVLSLIDLLKNLTKG